MYKINIILDNEIVNSYKSPIIHVIKKQNIYWTGLSWLKD